MALETPNPPLLMADPLDIPQDNGPFKPRTAQDETPQRVWDEGLGSFDVFSLIVNKMIGTGIYTSPAVVYRMTGSKSITLALFGVGFVYCLMSTAIYLQYAEVLPYNGGELIYLDEITASEKPPSIDAPTDAGPHPGGPPTQPSSRSTGLGATLMRWYRRLMGDGLLAYIIYALAFILFFNSATNSQQFGRMILLCIHADKKDNVNDVKEDQHLMRFIAVTVLSVICLAQFFSPGFGRRLNKFLAVIKIGFLIGLIAVGLSALGKDLKDVTKRDSDRALDWSQRHDVESKVSFAKALLVVLFSFEGWENATFVAGEIPRSKQKVLRRGFLTAAITVGSLYLIVVAVSLHSLAWDEVYERGGNINYAPLLTGDTSASRRAWAIIIAISAFGSLNAIIYTFSRVKQVIGQAEVLPWSRYLKQDDCLNRRQRTRENAFHYKSPQGGLIAHWVASVALIAISASIQSTLESVGLAGYIQTYTHCFILMILGIGYLNLRSRNESLNSLGRTQERSTPAGRFFEALILVSTPIYVLLNLAILVINAVPPYSGSGGQDSVFPGYGFPVIVASLVTVGTLYYLLFFGAVRRYYEAIPSDEGSEEELPHPRVCEGILSPTNPLNLMKYAGVVCEMRKDYSYKSVERVFRFGRRWKMIYSITGYDSEDSDAPTLDRQGLTFAMVLYWAFGGTRLKEDRTPWAKLKEHTERLFSW